jgi:hypothetical protein
VKKLALPLVVLAGLLLCGKTASAQYPYFAPVYGYPVYPVAVAPRVVYRPAYPVYAAPVIAAPIYTAPVVAAPVYITPGYVARQKTYIPFQPARNVIRAVTPGARVVVY